MSVEVQFGPCLVLRGLDQKGDDHGETPLMERVEGIEIEALGALQLGERLIRPRARLQRAPETVPAASCLTVTTLELRSP